MTNTRVAAITALLTATAINIALLLTARLTGWEVTHDEQRMLAAGFIANVLALWLLVVTVAVERVKSRNN